MYRHAGLHKGNSLLHFQFSRLQLVVFALGMLQQHSNENCVRRQTFSLCLICFVLKLAGSFGTELFNLLQPVFLCFYKEFTKLSSNLIMPGREGDTAVDLFVQSLNASPCSLNLKNAGCEGSGQMALLLQSFQIDPINNRHAARSSHVLLLGSPAPETVWKTRHNYSRKWNYHNIYSRLKQNISEHFSSEKAPPPSTYNRKAAFMLRDNQGE